MCKPEPFDCNDDERNAHARLDRNPTESSTDLSLESIIMKRDDSKYDSHDQEMLESNEQILNFKDLTASTPVKVNAFENNNNSNSCSPAFEDDIREGSTSSSSEESKLANAVSLPECEIEGETKKPASLQEELEDSAYNSPTMDVNQNPVRKTRNMLTRCSSFDEGVKENSDDESVARNRSVSECQSSEKTDNLSDSATESEFASYPHRALLNKVRIS